MLGVCFVNFMFTDLVTFGFIHSVQAWALGCIDASVVLAMRRNMSNNGITGGLPTNWGWNNVFTQLQILTLDHNGLSGSLPPTYNTPGSFKSLIVMNLDHNNLTGMLLTSHSFLFLDCITPR